MGEEVPYVGRAGASLMGILGGARPADGPSKWEIIPTQGMLPFRLCSKHLRWGIRRSL